MIISDYATFRHRFGTPGTVALDGHRAWPSVVTRRSSYWSLLAEPKFPERVFMSLGDVDVDAYIAQGTDDASKARLSVERLYTGFDNSTYLDVRITAAGIAAIGRDPGSSLLSADEIETLFKGCHLYGRIVSSGALIYADLFADFGGIE